MGGGHAALGQLRHLLGRHLLLLNEQACQRPDQVGLGRQLSDTASQQGNGPGWLPGLHFQVGQGDVEASLLRIHFQAPLQELARRIVLPVGQRQPAGGQQHGRIMRRDLLGLCDIGSGLLRVALFLSDPGASKVRRERLRIGGHHRVQHFAGAAGIVQPAAEQVRQRRVVIYLARLVRDCFFIRLRRRREFADRLATLSEFPLQFGRRLRIVPQQDFQMLLRVGITPDLRMHRQLHQLPTNFHP